MLDWDDTLARLNAHLSALRVAAVAAGTTSVQAAAAEQARKVEEDLAELTARLARKKAFETSAQVMKLSPLFDAEAELVTARAFSADESLRFQYTDQLRQMTSEREGREHEIFRDLAMKLDYRDQEAAYKSLLLARRGDRIAPAVLCGDQDHGLTWVYRRLRCQVPPSVEPPFVVKHCFRAAAIEQNVASLKASLVKLLGLPPSADRQRVFDRICDKWRTTNVIFVFSRIEGIGAPGLTRLLEDFWAPLVSAARGRRPAAASTWIAAFFLHEGDPSALEGAPVCEAAAKGSRPETPVLLPRLGKLDEAALGRWQSDHGLDFPECLQTGEALAEIARETGGAPGDVFYEICRRWEYDFTVLSDLWEQI